MLVNCIGISSPFGNAVEVQEVPVFERNRLVRGFLEPTGAMSYG